MNSFSALVSSLSEILPSLLLHWQRLAAVRPHFLKCVCRWLPGSQTMYWSIGGSGSLFWTESILKWNKACHAKFSMTNISPFSNSELSLKPNSPDGSFVPGQSDSSPALHFKAGPKKKPWMPPHYPNYIQMLSEWAYSLRLPFSCYFYSHTRKALIAVSHSGSIFYTAYKKEQGDILTQFIKSVPFNLDNDLSCH